MILYIRGTYRSKSLSTWYEESKVSSLRDALLFLSFFFFFFFTPDDRQNNILFSLSVWKRKELAATKFANDIREHAYYRGTVYNWSQKYLNALFAIISYTFNTI